MSGKNLAQKASYALATGLTALALSGCGGFYTEQPQVRITDPQGTAVTYDSTYDVTAGMSFGSFDDCTLERIADGTTYSETKDVDGHSITFTVPLELNDQYSTDNHVKVECSGPNGASSDNGLIIRVNPDAPRE